MVVVKKVVLGEQCKKIKCKVCGGDSGGGKRPRSNKPSNERTESLIYKD